MIADHPAHLSVRDRTKLRVNEQRKLEHACKVLEDLIGRHMNDMAQAHGLHELHVLQMQLTTLIKNQHIKDADYAGYKTRKAFIPLDIVDGF